MIKGAMKLPLGGREFAVYGGSYYFKPDDAIGIRMAAEIDRPAEAVVPVRDMSIPGRETYPALYGALLAALYELSKGRKVYVGCMGGIGRTGLFMALLARLAGIPHPVAYVRANYTFLAVETPEQERFVREFDLFPLRLAVKGAVARVRERDKCHTLELAHA